MSQEGAIRDLHVVVPCRNEARVIERKLANLARVRWPAGAHEHRLTVVDDGSEDGTTSLAERALEVNFGSRTDVSVRVLQNRFEPGKAGTLASALADPVGDSNELVVLTDADVILRAGALEALTDAFRREPGLALACGAQEFVRDLAPDGTERGADLRSPRPASDVYDRATAWVRALESRFGALFSVHGQLLAWRADSGWLPRPGLASDDLDLMFSARSSCGRRVRRVAHARFLEVKTPAGADRRGQDRRRAQGYFQVLEGRRHPLGSRPADRLQWAFYAHAPAFAPAVACALALAAVAGSTWIGGWLAGSLVFGLLGLAALSRPGKRVVELLGVIARARRAAHRTGLSDRWEMRRA